MRIFFVLHRGRSKPFVNDHVTTLPHQVPIAEHGLRLAHLEFFLNFHLLWYVVQLLRPCAFLDRGDTVLLRLLGFRQLPERVVRFDPPRWVPPFFVGNDGLVRFHVQVPVDGHCGVLVLLRLLVPLIVIRGWRQRRLIFLLDSSRMPLLEGVRRLCQLYEAVGAAELVLRLLMLLLGRVVRERRLVEEGLVVGFQVLRRLVEQIGAIHDLWAILDIL